MTEAKTYNGWSNRETWLLHLHLSNSQDLYLECRDLALEASSDLAGGEAIREWAEAWLDRGIAHSPHEQARWLLRDMMTQVFGRCDWAEVGRAFREE